MKALLLFCLVVLLTGCYTRPTLRGSGKPEREQGAASEEVASIPAPLVRVEYDRFDDETVYTLVESIPLVPQRMFPKDGGPNVLHLNAYGSCPGNVRCSPQNLQLVLVSNNLEGWVFLDHHDLTVIVDGHRVRFGEMAHSGKVRDGGSVTETMVAPVTTETLRLLGRANSVDARLGTFELLIDGDLLRPLVAFADSVSEGIPASDLRTD